MSENRRIAKNTLVLYIRLLISTVIGLYSSRLILIELGVADFGLYSVVGGLIAMMNFMNASMVATSNRFIAIELGKKNGSELNKIFNALLLLHIGAATLLLILVEVGGIWYIHNYLNVSVEKIPDALFVLHLSALSAVLTTIVVPFQGVITSNEKFNVRAGLEILQSTLHLIAVLLLVFHESDKLRAYALYVLIITLTITLIYLFYCRSKYYSIVKWQWNKSLIYYKEIINFLKWQVVYILGTIGSNQGGAIIINLYFGTVLNAAFGIALRVNSMVFSFVKTLNQAALPQIMKNYSGGNQSRSLMLTYKLSKFTYFIMLIPAVPLIILINPILVIWLKDVPPYTSWFIIFRLIHGLISCLESGFDATIDATGNIKKTKIVFSVLFLFTLPGGYVLYKYGFPPYTIILLYILAEVVFLLIQTKILISLTEFKISEYLNWTIFPAAMVTGLLLPQYLLYLISSQNPLDVLLITIGSIFYTTTVIYFVGLTKDEKIIIKNYIFSMKPFKLFYT